MKKLFIIFLIFKFSSALAQDYIILQTTTSVDNSGLLNIIEKKFEKKLQIDLRAVVSGSLQAIANAKKGNADLIITHSKEDEIKFVEEGYGVKRFNLMYNDFVIIGPANDPASIKDEKNIIDVMKKLGLGEWFFLSRDDNSGTHKKEQYLWKIANVEINSKNNWYLKTGGGMATTLNAAQELNAYTLSDRATWLAFNNKKNLEILFEKDQNLFNSYSIIAVNPKKFSHIKYDLVMIFIEWLLSEEGKLVISDYKINGEQLFYTY